MRDLYENLVRGALNEEPLTIKETIDEIMTAHISPIIEGYKLHVAENMLGASANTASDETELDDAEEFDDEDEVDEDEVDEDEVDEDEVDDEDDYTDEADDEDSDEDDEADEDTDETEDEDIVEEDMDPARKARREKAQDYAFRRADSSLIKASKHSHIANKWSGENDDISDPSGHGKVSIRKNTYPADNRPVRSDKNQQARTAIVKKHADAHKKNMHHYKRWTALSDVKADKDK